MTLRLIQDSLLIVHSKWNENEIIALSYECVYATINDNKRRTKQAYYIHGEGH